MTTSIAVPTTGFYRLYLSAGGPAALYLADPSTGAPQQRIAEVLPAQNDLHSGEWTTFDTQRSEPLQLEAGKVYHIEMRYLATSPLHHCQIAWSGPGIDGIQPLDNDSLAQTVFRNKYYPNTQLLQHDYDTPGQTSTLWPANTAIEPAPPGMSGNAERVTGDVGGNAEERIVFDQISSDHLYATWLFNMDRSHVNMSLMLLRDAAAALEGPRIRMESLEEGAIASVRAGGNGTASRIDVTFDHTYRVEIVATTTNAGFEYATPNGLETVAKDTFDIYISDTSAHLIGSAKGLTFRDREPDLIPQFAVLEADFFIDPNIAFDAFDITSGYIAGDGYLVGNHTAPDDSDAKQFYQLEVTEIDQDGDGLSDWEELALAKYNPVLFFDAQSDGEAPATCRP